jgi:hypothetical protein
LYIGCAVHMRISSLGFGGRGPWMKTYCRRESCISISSSL